MIERWELIQAQSLSEKHRHKQNLQQWQQLISDLQTMRAWLGQSEAELNQLRGLDLSTDIHTIQQRIKKLKVCLLCVCFSFRVCLSMLKKKKIPRTPFMAFGNWKHEWEHWEQRQFFVILVLCTFISTSPCTVYFQELYKKYSLSAVN